MGEPSSSPHHEVQVADLGSGRPADTHDKRSLLLTLYRSLVLCESGFVAGQVFAMIR